MKWNKALFLFIFSISAYSSNNKEDTAPNEELEVSDIITTLKIDCIEDRWIEGTVELKHEDAFLFFDTTLATLSYNFDCQEEEISDLNLIHEKREDIMYLEKQVADSVHRYIIDKPESIKIENLPLTFHLHHDGLLHSMFHRFYTLKINDIALSAEISRENLRAYISERDYIASERDRPITNGPIQKELSIDFRARFHSIKISYSYKRIYN